MCLCRGHDHTDKFPPQVGGCLGHRDWSILLELVRGVLRFRRFLWDAPIPAGVECQHWTTEESEKGGVYLKAILVRVPPLATCRLNPSRGTTQASQTSATSNQTRSTSAGTRSPRDPAKPTTPTLPKSPFQPTPSDSRCYRYSTRPSFDQTTRSLGHVSRRS